VRSLQKCFEEESRQIQISVLYASDFFMTIEEAREKALSVGLNDSDDGVMRYVE